MSRGGTVLGLRGPRTVQGEITSNVDVLTQEFDERKRFSERNPGKTYPGGGDVNNLHIMKGESVLSWQQIKGRRGGKRGSNGEAGFTSINGIANHQYDSVEDLQDRLYYVGISKLNYKVLSEEQPKSGLSVIRYGASTYHYTGRVPSYPGDTMVWKLPDIHFRSGQFKPNSHSGKPRGKLLAILEPLDWQELDYYLLSLYTTIMDKGDDGIYGMSVRKLLEENIRGLNRKKEAALAFKKHTLMTAMRSIESLSERNIVTINTPERNARKKNKEFLLRGFLEMTNMLLPDKFKLSVKDFTSGSGSISGFSMTKKQFVLVAVAMSADRGDEIPDILPSGDEVDESGALFKIYGKIYDTIMEFMEREREVVPTDVSKPRPEGRNFTKLDESLRIWVEDDHFKQNHAFFKNGLHWSIEGLSSSQVKDLIRERERATLWLAHVTGAIGEDPEQNVQDDIINTVWFKYNSAVELQMLFAPAFTKDFFENEKNRFNSTNRTNFREEYTQNAWDFSLQFQSALAWARYQIARRVVGESTSYAGPKLDQTHDIVLGVHANIS